MLSDFSFALAARLGHLLLFSLYKPKAHAVGFPHTNYLVPAYYLLATNSSVTPDYSFALAARLGHLLTLG